MRFSKMFLKRMVTLFFLSFFIIGCDKVYKYSISNKSGVTLIIEATYNDSYIDSLNIEKSLHFNLHPENIINTDTVNHKVKLRLPPDEDFCLGFSINRIPNLSHNKEILIFKNDSLVFYGNQYIIQNLYTNSNQDQSEVINIY